MVGRWRRLKYSYSMKGHMDPDYGGTCRGPRHMVATGGRHLNTPIFYEGTHGPRLWVEKGGGASCLASLNTPIL